MRSFFALYYHRTSTLQIYRPPEWEQHDGIVLVGKHSCYLFWKTKVSLYSVQSLSGSFQDFLSIVFLLAIADFRNLHGKFQAFASLMAGLKEAAINVTVTVAVVVGVVFIGGLVVSIGWTTGIYQPVFTGIRQHYKKVPKLAEQAGQDKSCTFIWEKGKAGRHEKKGMLDYPRLCCCDYAKMR